jgi:EpsI family protein
MNSTVTRLAILIALVVAVHCGFILVRAGTQPAQVALPTRSIHELPRTLGTWHGEDAELDSKIFVGTAAHAAVDRTYTDRLGHSTSVFVALYDDPAAGVYHTPSNCYRQNGWTNISEVRIPLECPGRPTVSVSLSTWESSGQRVQVVCWYEMGEYVLFDRGDWGLLRLKLRGQTTWPPMYKVLLQAQATDSLTSARLLELAGTLRAWLGELDTTPAPAGRAP